MTIEGDPLLDFISSRLSNRSARSAGGRSAGGTSAISAATSFKHEASTGNEALGARMAGFYSRPAHSGLGVYVWGGGAAKRA